MPNMKAPSLTFKEVMGNIKAPSLTVKEILGNVKFFQSVSKVTVKVTCSKFTKPSERSCHKEHMTNMKALSLTVEKLRPMLEFLMKRVITIEHLPNGWALMNKTDTEFLTACKYV